MSWAIHKNLNVTPKSNTNMTKAKTDCRRRGYLLCVASDFLFNLPGLKDALSLLEN